ncbi:hypothetical protein MLD38_031467 [Melastoma candidum]|uniref:Uncharacterized protein n=1 Tax=Melastoma candidum TaxID=119954 RepID=A0ACB9MPS1_9MYRT|nr:hypothetical protein MLD38_031467 [Melastoma candidum]
MNARRSKEAGVPPPHLNPPLRARMDVPASKSAGAEKSMTDRRRANRQKKTALMRDVDKLKRKLRHEENVHRALERAFSRPLGALPRLPPYLPPYTLELLAEVAVLEEEVVRLEEQVVSFRQGLYQEAVYISSKRNGEVSSELDEESTSPVSRTRHERSKSMSSSIISRSQPGLSRSMSIRKPAASDPTHDRIGNRKRVVASPVQVEDSAKEICSSVSSKSVTPIKGKVVKLESSEGLGDSLRDPAVARQNSVDCPGDGDTRWDGTPNKLSEDIVRCLSSIFQRATTRKSKNLESYSLDPYTPSPDSVKTDVGPYKTLLSIDASSVDLSRRTNSMFLKHRLKFFLRKLAAIKLEELTHRQKLAFWINIYNSCIMNAILEHGIPENPEMVAELMQKATMVVGGQVLNAITIEHFVLRLPYHSKLTCPKAVKNDNLKGHCTFGLEWSEPLVTFTLSCGSWSSPAVRVYTASKVEDELESSKRDFLRAAVGISKANQLMIPKLLEWYLQDVAKDLESLLDWSCLQLPDGLRTQEGTGERLSRPVQVMPYDFSFRLLIQQQ